MKKSIQKLCLCLCFSLSGVLAFANYNIWTNQYVKSGDCLADVSVYISGEAGPFNMYLYSSITQYYSNSTTYALLDIQEGIHTFPTIRVQNNIQNPVVLIVDALGCEHIYKLRMSL